MGPRSFDVQAFFEALDARRRTEGLSWSAVARLIWAQSEILNAQRDDHPISPSTITRIPSHGDTSCQHALFMLRWLGEPPEAFIAEPTAGTSGVPLPTTDAAHRLRWDLGALHDALNAARIERNATWQQTAYRLHCTANQLTGLRTVKFAISMRLAMRICQALSRPGADFVYAAQW